MEYVIRILEKDLVRLEWLLSNHKGQKSYFVQRLEEDVSTLKDAIKILNTSEKTERSEVNQ